MGMSLEQWVNGVMSRLCGLLGKDPDVERLSSRGRSSSTSLAVRAGPSGPDGPFRSCSHEASAVATPTLPPAAARPGASTPSSLNRGGGGGGGGPSRLTSSTGAGEGASAVESGGETAMPAPTLVTPFAGLACAERASVRLGSVCDTTEFEVR